VGLSIQKFLIKGLKDFDFIIKIQDLFKKEVQRILFYEK
jgi:hypothetical protein